MTMDEETNFISEEEFIEIYEGITDFFMQIIQELIDELESHDINVDEKKIIIENVIQPRSIKIVK
jgi:hypothetical protein